MINNTKSEDGPVPAITGAAPRTTTNFWNEQWDEREARHSLSSFLHRQDFGKSGHFLKLMDRIAPNVFSHARVCELGGASSKFLIDLALYKSARVTAIDYSPTGIEQTKALFTLWGVKGDVVLADMFNWDGPKDQFDVVTHWGLLEHFEDPIPVLVASANLIKPGGTLVFSMPNMAAKGAALWHRLAPSNFAAHVYHTDGAIAEACKAAGLTLEKIYYSGPPLLRMSPAEKSGLLPLVVDVAHFCALAAAAIFPSMFLNGHPKISNTRNFLVTKA